MSTDLKAGGKVTIKGGTIVYEISHIAADHRGEAATLKDGTGGVVMNVPVETLVPVAESKRK